MKKNIFKRYQSFLIKISTNQLKLKIMNTNKMSAMLQANKIWTITAMMGYHVTMSICKNNEYLNAINVTIFFEKDDVNAETSILSTIHHNWNDGDTTETKYFDDFNCITYTITWKEE